MIQGQVRDKLKKMRADSGLSQSDFAKEVGSSKNQVSSIERGADSVGLSTIIKWCEARGVSLGGFFSTVGAPQCKSHSVEGNRCILVSGHEGLHESEEGERWL